MAKQQKTEKIETVKIAVSPEDWEKIRVLTELLSTHEKIKKPLTFEEVAALLLSMAIKEIPEKELIKSIKDALDKEEKPSKSPSKKM